jgi:cytochrome c-type biogenesis protein CcmH
MPPAPGRRGAWGRWGPWALLAVVVVGALVVASRDDPATPAERADALAHRIACDVCDGESVAESRSTPAAQQRADIAARIAAGQSDAEILDAYAEQYGEEILLKPSADGVGILVYAVPIAVVLLGALGLGLAVRRWQREPSQVATADDLVLVARERRDHHDARDDAQHAGDPA